MGQIQGILVATPRTVLSVNTLALLVRNSPIAIVLISPQRSHKMNTSTLQSSVAFSFWEGFGFGDTGLSLRGVVQGGFSPAVLQSQGECCAIG